MRAIRSFIVLVVGLLTAPAVADGGPPPVAREFRGVWVATVGNIDWPSKPGLPVPKQKAELIAILDKARALGFNAIIFQVRPAADALYDSPLEPWSVFLTGEQGRPPEPFYDPLTFATRQAHARGLQLHAWINPFRAKSGRGHESLAESHVAKTHPEWVKEYGNYLWMDPGVPAVRNHSLAVVKDIVTRYDVDGIHLDDYFYPYKVRDEEGNIIDFPDEASYLKYQQSGGTLGRDDWRRQNVNRFIKRLYQTVKQIRPRVLVGISPFGIWRPGHPKQIQGLDAYSAIYADSRKWFREGWCDYLSPQLYWPIGQRAQDYIVLQDWWIDQNIKGRHLWPGLYTSKVGRQWEPAEIARQVEATRRAEGAGGNIHFSMKSLMGDRDELEKAIRKLHAEPALVPASPWLGGEQPPAPSDVSLSENGARVVWTGNNQAALWIVQFQRNSNWQTRTLPACSNSVVLPDGAKSVFVTAVSRTGILSDSIRVLPQ